MLTNGDLVVLTLNFLTEAVYRMFPYSDLSAKSRFIKLTFKVYLAEFSDVEVPERRERSRQTINFS